MKKGQLTINFQSATIVAHLEHLTTDMDFIHKLAEIDEKEQRKIIMILNRIEKKGGSISHFLKYLKEIV
ncbi:hypothetical protein G5B10_11760 [Fluviicola sp. SGL-29]|nr:hypothetical protein [Fluviicola sp. SGL-29]